MYDTEATLPNAVAKLFDGADPGENVGVTAELITTDPDGWPRVGLLSTGEVIAVEATRLRIALWPDSHTTANLTRTGQATLACVLEEAAYSIRLRTCRGDELPSPLQLAVFDGRVIEVRRDVVPYAVLESGITFRLLDKHSVVERWRATTAALARHAGCDPDGGH